MKVKLRISGRHYAQAFGPIFSPPDGEGGRRGRIVRPASRGRIAHCLCVHELLMIPYESCAERSPVRVTWPTSLLVPSLERAMKRQWAIVKIHSHRGH